MLYGLIIGYVTIGCILTGAVIGYDRELNPRIVTLGMIVWPLVMLVAIGLKLGSQIPHPKD